MPLSRRRLLAAATAMPIVLLVDQAIRAAGDAIRTAAASARPSAVGTSVDRCAQCGATDHTMLDRRCPAAKRFA